MTQAQIDRAGSARAGVWPRTDHRTDFGLPPGADGKDDIRPVVACPLCGRPVPHPGWAGDGSPILAECPDPACDVYFDFDPSRAYAPIS